MAENDQQYFDQIQAAKERRDVELEIEKIAERIKKSKKGELKMSKDKFAQEQLLLKAKKDELKLLEKV